MATLQLSDGTTFHGQSFGAPLDDARGDTSFASGEVVFNTGMVGYPESMTDPSYRGQILVFTYPLIGNYGVPSEEKNAWGFSKNLESEAIHVRGIVVASASEDYSHFAAVSSLGRWMEHHGIPGITGIDTRALTKKLREHGVMLGRIQMENGKLKIENEIEDPNKQNLVAEVSCTEPITYEPEGECIATIVAFDCGMKRNILRSFLKRGVRVHRVPWNYDLQHSTLPYDGVFISNGPGDPKACVPTIKSIRWSIDQGIPTFGICLGNQLMALAVGGDTFKLKYGHRGANQPCQELKMENGKWKMTERCIITSQNHGFAVDEKSLPKGWHVWFKNANDGSVEGIAHESGRFRAVQFHPEATPGPEDANELFDEFLALIKGKNH
ncbi:glutamine-hydrolyzing carbamoyl-phosphate synthase small subunit [Candidatus Peribacteria bacterium]|nr:glutamine-hydrolyzing carbamoyl-phosphate synthase small subunit [Candidatus Peribacteria bacterium]